ncbi:uncharacterized protein METZ01_LOCUS249100, partial [marine metagenome]
MSFKKLNYERSTEAYMARASAEHLS